MEIIERHRYGVYGCESLAASAVEKLHNLIKCCGYATVADMYRIVCIQEFPIDHEYHRKGWRRCVDIFTSPTLSRSENCAVKYAVVAHEPQLLNI